MGIKDYRDEIEFVLSWNTPKDLDEPVSATPEELADAIRLAADAEYVKESAGDDITLEKAEEIQPVVSFRLASDFAEPGLISALKRALEEKWGKPVVVADDEMGVFHIDPDWFISEEDENGRPIVNKERVGEWLEHLNEVVNTFLEKIEIMKEYKNDYDPLWWLSRRSPSEIEVLHDSLKVYTLDDHGEVKPQLLSEYVKQNVGDVLTRQGVLPEVEFVEYGKDGYATIVRNSCEDEPYVERWDSQQRKEALHHYYVHALGSIQHNDNAASLFLNEESLIGHLRDTVDMDKFDDAIDLIMKKVPDSDERAIAVTRLEDAQESFDEGNYGLSIDLVRGAFNALSDEYPEVAQDVSNMLKEIENRLFELNTIEHDTSSTFSGTLNVNAIADAVKEEQGSEKSFSLSK